ncbi:septal ring lytic transglycosylase RlpA family protein [Pusillimonas sp. SM2304]|uniref:septal ring lytic transglycosylase RlpA family protein n=1 Tax=Pusillimonas sp. SM2304 TaxID=3073241 RepID=UPI002874851F|nr:septal ring lytic transglycosylase RlpA family protein [Pusillimonas sp. SM2304]MDS1139275.1 septal ring lytic transglycosylase RlpA family protein [Pusillimonas sp. SM2304]
MTRIRTLIIALLSLGALVLAGCSGPGGSGGGSRGGGYYKDDGPGSNIPADIEAIPNAVPRVETHARANFKPYVVFGKRYVPVSDERPFRQEGTASWYGRKFHGKKTANGETYDMHAMTAAHPTLPLPSYARVTRASTGKSVIVRINDRGPFHSSRIIDLSYVAAAKLGIIGPGSGQVIVEAITNQDIRDNNYEQPKATPIPPAAVPAPPVLTTQAPPDAAPAIPDALDALQHDDGQVIAAAPPAPTASPAQAPGATSDTMAAPGGQVYLQFGAFSAQQTADSLAQKLNAQIGEVESRPAHVQASSNVYRVQIGPYPSRTAAVNAALRIQQETGQQPSMALR